MKLTPELLVRAYASGLFPMAESRGSDEVAWYAADPRAVIPLDGFHVSRSLRRTLRQAPFEVRVDTAFEAVVRGCAEPRPYADETWINEEIVRAYTALHRLGLAHSVEAWERDADTASAQAGGSARAMEGAAIRDTVPADRLLGGIYGVALGGAFFGESMFSRVSGASKVCLAHLAERLRRRGYALFDVQMSNPHLEQFGVRELPEREYLAQLHRALELPVAWD